MSALLISGKKGQSHISVQGKVIKECQWVLSETTTNIRVSQESHSSQKQFCLSAILEKIHLKSPSWTPLFLLSSFVIWNIK